MSRRPAPSSSVQNARAVSSSWRGGLDKRGSKIVAKHPAELMEDRFKDKTDKD